MFQKNNNDKEDKTMQVKFQGHKEGHKISIKMIVPTGEQKTVITMDIPQGGDWRADVDFYDEIEAAYKKRLRRAFHR